MHTHSSAGQPGSLRSHVPTLTPSGAATLMDMASQFDVPLRQQIL